MEQRVHMERCQDSLDACEEAGKSCLVFRWEARAAEPEMWLVRDIKWNTGE